MAPHTSERILIVDDEPSVVRALAQLLGRAGYRVDTASNGRQALAQLQVRRCDVILSDLRMPEVDGRAFYALVRQHYAYLRQRVIFLTGNSGDTDTRAFLEQCGARWLAKPCTAAEVCRAIEQVLHAAGPPQPPGPAGGDRRARSVQLWRKSQALRHKSQTLAGKVQVLYAQSRHLRAQAARLKGGCSPGNTTRAPREDPHVRRAGTVPLHRACGQEASPKGL